MSEELKQAAQQALEAYDAFADADDFSTLFELTRKMNVLRDLTQRPAAQAEQWLVAAVDAAMVEMKNISPPLRRSECERLIRAAAECMPAPPAVHASAGGASSGFSLLRNVGAALVGLPAGLGV